MLSYGALSQPAAGVQGSEGLGIHAPEDNRHSERFRPGLESQRSSDRKGTMRFLRRTVYRGNAESASECLRQGCAWRENRRQTRDYITCAIQPPPTTSSPS